MIYGKKDEKGNPKKYSQKDRDKLITEGKAKSTDFVSLPDDKAYKDWENRVKGENNFNNAKSQGKLKFREENGKVIASFEGKDFGSFSSMKEAEDTAREYYVNNVGNDWGRDGALRQTAKKYADAQKKKATTTTSTKPSTTTTNTTPSTNTSTPTTPSTTPATTKGGTNDDNEFASLVVPGDWDATYQNITNKINELKEQSEAFSMNGQEVNRKIADETLDRLLAFRDKHLEEGKKSDDPNLVDTANQYSDATISPEEGTANKEKVSSKAAKGEELTEDEKKTLSANVDSIDRTQTKGGRTETMEDVIDRYDLNNQNKDDGNGTGGTTDTQPPADDNENKDDENKDETTPTDGGDDDGEQTPPPPPGPENKSFWDRLKKYGAKAYPTLKAITDMISKNARMNLDRAGLLTGGQRDLDAYKPIETETDKIREAQIESRAKSGTTVEEAMAAARDGDITGIQNLVASGDMTLEQAADATNLSKEALGQVFEGRMTIAQAQAEQAQIKTEADKKQVIKTYEDQIQAANDKIQANKDFIRLLEGDDIDALKQYAQTLIGIYGGRQTTGSTDTDEHHDGFNGNFNLNIGAEAAGAGGGIGGGSGSSTSNTTTTSQDALLLAKLPGIVADAKAYMGVKNEANAEFQDYLKKANEELEAKIEGWEQDIQRIKGIKVSSQKNQKQSTKMDFEVPPKENKGEAQQ